MIIDMLVVWNDGVEVAEFLHKEPRAGEARGVLKFDEEKGSWLIYDKADQGVAECFADILVKLGVTVEVTV